MAPNVSLFRTVSAMAFSLSLALGTVATADAGGRLGAASLSSPAAAAADSTDRLILKLRDPAERDPDRRIAEIGGRAGERLLRLRAVSDGSHVVRLSRAVPL